MLTEERFSRRVRCLHKRSALSVRLRWQISPRASHSSLRSFAGWLRGQRLQGEMMWHAVRGLVREPCRACTGQCARVPVGQALPDSLDPGWSSGHSGSAPAHALGVDTARSGVTRHLHGRSLTWFEPVSAAGFASVQLSWFCFAAVIVFNPNAAQHKEVVALFLLLSSQHQGWLCKNCLSCPPCSLLFLDRPLPHSSPKQSYTPPSPREREQLFSHPLLGCPRPCSQGQ